MKNKIIMYISYLNLIYLSFEEEIYSYEYNDLESVIKNIFDKLNLESDIEIYLILNFNFFSKENDFLFFKDSFLKYNLKGIYSLQEYFKDGNKYLIIQDEESYIIENEKIEKEKFTKNDFENDQDFSDYIVINDENKIVNKIFSNDIKLKKNYLKRKNQYLSIIFLIFIILIFLIVNNIFSIEKIKKEKEKINLEIIKLEEKLENEKIEKEEIKLSNIEIEKNKIYEDIYFLLNDLDVSFIKMNYFYKIWELELIIPNKEYIEILEEKILKKYSIYELKEIINLEEKIKINIKLGNKYEKI